MNKFTNNLFSVIVIIFLLILLLIAFGILVEYIRFLWMRHKIRKSCRQMEKFLKNNQQVFDEGKEKELDEAFQNILRENGIEVIPEENNDDMY